MKEITRMQLNFLGGKMKKTLAIAVLIAVFMMAFGSVAYAAGAMWNFEKDHGGVTGSVFMDPNGPTTNNPGGTALDSRGRPARLNAGVTYANAYQRGAAGSGNMYGSTTNTLVVAGTFASDLVSGTAGQTYYKVTTVTSPAPGTVGIMGPGRYVYLSWWAVDPLDARHVVDTANTGISPHGGYTTTSIKCAVCHVVHAAAPGKDAAGTVVADTLLRFKASDSCGYCHVAAGSTVVDPVYGGVWPIPAEAGHALASPTCGECHASVHGANAETIPPVAGLLLKTKVAEEIASRAYEGLDYNTSIIDRVTAIEASAVAAGYGADSKVTGFNVSEYNSLSTNAIRQQAVGVFCGGCHIGSYAGTVAGARAGAESGTLLGTSPYSGHRTMAAATDNWNATGAISSGGTGATPGTGFKIADVAAQDCKGCHDSYNGFGTGTKAFPHNWGTAGDEPLELVGGVFENQSMTWLLAAPDSSAEPTRNGGAIGKAGHAGPAGGTLSDGVCLKCHKWTDGGVGASF